MQDFLEEYLVMRQFILLAISIFFIEGCSDSHNLKTNLNCTTKVVLFWGDTPLKKRQNILAKAFSINVNLDIKNNVKDIPIKEMGSLKEYEWLYFMYDSDEKQCLNKVKYTTLSLNRYLDVIVKSPKYKIIENISKRELDIVKNQQKYNIDKELKNWLNVETINQLQ